MLSLSVLSVLIASAAYAAARAGAAHASSSSRAQLDDQATRGVREIALRLRAADAEGLVPTPGADFGLDRLAFRSLHSTPQGGVEWSPFARFELADEVGDPDDGLDNDGDGLVDEKRVLFQPDLAAPARRGVRAHDVTELLEGELANGLDDNGNGLIDEAGLCFSAEEGILTVRVTLAAPLEAGRVHVRTAERSLRLRN